MNLTLPDSADPQSGAPLSPMTLPPVNARLANLRINGEDFGEWQADLRPSAQGVRINNLQGRWRASRIQGTVDWTEEGGNQYTRFNGSLASDNLGRSLSAWGLPEMIESDDANAKVSLGWPHWPLAPDYLLWMVRRRWISANAGSPIPTPRPRSCGFWGCSIWAPFSAACGWISPIYTRKG